MLIRAAFAATVSTTLLLGSAAVAQSADPSSTLSSAPVTFLTESKGSEWRASKLDGLDVYNTNDQLVGKIRELLIDGNGHINAAIIGVGGFLGFHEHDVALSFDQISWVGDARSGAGAGTPRHAVLDMTKDQLMAAPEFPYTP